MKKNIIFGLGLVAFLVGAKLSFGAGQKTTTTITMPPTVNTAIITNLYNGGLKLFEIQLANGGNSAVTWALIDSPNTNYPSVPFNTLLTYSNAGYATYAYYLTNIPKTNTTFSGILVTNYQSNAVYTYSNFVNGATNSFRTVFSGVLAAGSGQVLTIPVSDEGAIFAFGLTWTNNTTATNVAITYTYQSAQ